MEVDGDEADSLFAGMEFVSPVMLEDASPTVDEAAHPEEVAGAKDPSKSERSDDVASQSSSGDSQSVGGSQSEAGGAAEARKDPSMGVNGHVDRDATSHMDEKQASSASEVAKATAVRRKKKSIKIGYARETPGELQASLDELYAAAPQPATATVAAAAVGESEKNAVAGAVGEPALGKSKSEPEEDEKVRGREGRDAPSKKDAQARPQNAEETSKKQPDAGSRKRTEGRGTNVETTKAKVEEAVESTVEVPSEKPSANVGQNAVEETEATSEGKVGSGEDEGTVATVAQGQSPESSVDGAKREGQGEGEAGDATTLASELQGRLKQVLEELEREKEQIQQKVRQGTVVRKAMVQRKREAMQSMAKAMKELQLAEAEVAAACEREDFEAADVLSQKAEELQRDMDGAKVAAGFAQEECDKLVEELQELAHAEVEAEASAAAKLDAISKEATQISSESRQSAEDRAKEELTRVQLEMEAVGVKKRKVELERRVLKEQEADLAAKVDSLTEPERTERQQLLEGKEVLVNELEALLALVKEKEEEIAAQEDKIKQVDSKIEAVGARFGKMRSEMEEERERVDVLEREAEEKERELVRVKEEVERERERVEKEGEGLAEVKQQAEQEAEALKEASGKKHVVVLRGQSVRMRMVQLVEEEKGHEKDAQEIRDSTSSLQAEEQELAAKVAKLQQDAKSIAQRLELANRRLPELEAEKKLAAASRNFKEAARLAAEAKLLTNDKAAAAEEERKIVDQLKEAEKEAAVKQEELSQIDEMAREKQKASAVARCTRLFLESAQARQDMDLAAVMEDFEEAECLREEAEAWDKEVEQLCSLHNISKEDIEAEASKV